jgi:hypothetical protein
MKGNLQRFRFGVVFVTFVIAMGAFAIYPAILPVSE